MNPTASRAAFLGDGRLDRIAIALSGLCVVHCVVSVVAVTLLASVGGALLHPAVHEVGLVLAIGLGFIGLGHGIVTHGYMMPAAVGGLGLGVMMGAATLPHGDGEMLATLVGVGLVALGHDLNRRAVL